MRQSEPDGYIDRLPPQDLDAEQAVLGAVLHGGEAVNQVRAVIEARDFYRDAHRYIFEAALSLAERHEPTDTVAVANALRSVDRFDTIGGWEYLERLVRATPYTANATNYAVIVRGKAVARRVLFGCQDIAKTCNGPESEYTAPDQLAAKIEQQLRDLADQTKSEAPHQTFACSAVDCSAAWRSARVVDRTKISTGFPTLDHWLIGGIQRPETHLIVGRGGGGKSSMAIYLEAQAMLQGVRVGHIALELSRQMVTGRMYSVLSALRDGGEGVHVPHWALNDVSMMRLDWIRRAEEIDAWSREADRWHCVDFTLIDRSLFAVQSAIRYLAEERGCGIVTVDNFNNVWVPGAHGFDAGEAVARMLDDAAKQLRIPVMVCCQVGKAGAVYMSPKLEQDAGLSIEVAREQRSTEATLKTRKVREGAGEGTFALTGDPDTLCWWEDGAVKPPVDQPRPSGQTAAAGPDPDLGDDEDPWAVE